MLTKLLTGGLAAGAIAVPLAGVAWADPPANPGPPAVPGTNSPAPGGPAQTTPGQPAAPAANGQDPTCVVSANNPATNPTNNGSTASTAQWTQVATLQGSVASNLGLPAGQVAKVFCAPAGTPNPQGQPTGATGAPNALGQPGGTETAGQVPPAQPAGVSNPGQVPPAQ